jgi:hypothetical protein
MVKVLFACEEIVLVLSAVIASETVQIRHGTLLTIFRLYVPILHKTSCVELLLLDN